MVLFPLTGAQSSHSVDSFPVNNWGKNWVGLIKINFKNEAFTSGSWNRMCINACRLALVSLGTAENAPLSIGTICNYWHGLIRPQGRPPLIEPMLHLPRKIAEANSLWEPCPENSVALPGGCSNTHLMCALRTDFNSWVASVMAAYSVHRGSAWLVLCLISHPLSLMSWIYIFSSVLLLKLSHSCRLTELQSNTHVVAMLRLRIEYTPLHNLSTFIDCREHWDVPACAR